MENSVGSMQEEAMMHVENGDLDDALSAYDRILILEPENTVALLNKGAILQNTERASQALCCYDQVLEILPDNFDALLNKGSTLHAEGRYDDAILCYDRILQNYKSPITLLYKGLSLGELGRLEEAITHFDDALFLDKDLELARISKDTAQNLLRHKK